MLCFMSAYPAKRTKKGRLLAMTPFKPKFTITPKINKALVEIERMRGFLERTLF